MLSTVSNESDTPLFGGKDFFENVGATVNDVPSIFQNSQLAVIIGNTNFTSIHLNYLFYPDSIFLSSASAKEIKWKSSLLNS